MATRVVGAPGAGHPMWEFPYQLKIISADGCFVVCQEGGWRFRWDSFLLISPLPVLFLGGVCFFKIVSISGILADHSHGEANLDWEGPPGSLPDAHLER